MHRAPPRLRAAPLAAADPRPRARRRAGRGRGRAGRSGGPAAVLPAGAGHSQGASGADRRPPGRRRREDAGMTLLAGTVVVVSGVGPGLGRSIALQSARAGADLVLAARTASR